MFGLLLLFGIGGSGGEFTLFELVVVTTFLSFRASGYSVRWSIAYMAMGVIVPLTASRNTQCLIHSHERKETNHDTQTQEQIAVRLDHHKSHVLRGVFSQEDLREQMEQRITQESSNSERNHDRK